MGASIRVLERRLGERQGGMDREAPPAVRPNTVAYRSLGNGETDLSR